ncbi:MAG: hypothetical protein RR228_04080 [Bacilli bacterium]
MNNKIIINKAKCKKCNDIIESKTVHDFKWCSCGNIAVDGGQEYIKRFGNLDDIIELSEYEKKLKDTNKNKINI